MCKMKDGLSTLNFLPTPLSSLATSHHEGQKNFPGVWVKTSFQSVHGQVWCKYSSEADNRIASSLYSNT